MEPVSAAIVDTAAKSAAEATALQAESSGLALDAGLEVAAEAREAAVGEHGLLQQLDSIKSGSMEALAARNEAALSEVPQIEANRISGALREETVHGELARDYPAEDGYHIENECFLRDKTGEIVKDPVTGEGRRIDSAVIKDGEVVKSVEVTSETAHKTAQLEKEQRIRDAGGDYVRDRSSGELARFAPDVKTDIVRRA